MKITCECGLLHSGADPRYSMCSCGLSLGGDSVYAQDVEHPARDHEAALGAAEEKLRQIRKLLAFYNSNDPKFRERHERYFLRALGEPEVRAEWLS